MADGKVHNTIFEYVPPDRYHIVSDSQAELVIIGQKVYVKQGDVWTESKVSAASIINPNYYIVPEESTSDIQFIGTDSLNGKPMWVCQYTSKIKIGDTDSTSHIKLWIGATDNLPYKVVIDGEVAAIDSSTGKIVGVKAISTIFYEYDTTIKIDSPIK